MTAQDPALAPIAEKVSRAERLARADALALFESNDLLTIGRLADLANRHRNGDRVSFAANQHINPTNVCVLRNTFLLVRAHAAGRRRVHPFAR